MLLIDKAAKTRCTFFFPRFFCITARTASPHAFSSLVVALIHHGDLGGEAREDQVSEVAESTPRKFLLPMPRCPVKLI